MSESSGHATPPPPGTFTATFPRRVFLRRSLQMAGLLAALPATVGGCSRSREVAVPHDLRVLSPDEYLIADAFADALIPHGGAFEPGARDVDLIRHLDGFLTHEPEPVVRGLTSSLWTLEYGGVLLVGRFGRFTAMSAQSRTVYLQKLPLGFEIGRTIYLGLKHSLYFLFYNLDQTWQYVGYDGPWVQTESAS